MITINLEKELLQQNKSIVSAKELLKINEYEKVGDIDNDALERVGIKIHQQGKGLIAKNKELHNQTERFDQSRVFHKSQIKDLCEKYYLKFLPSCYYNGAIDKELPFKIANFEAIYEVSCKSKLSETDSWYGTSSAVGNTYIIAPKESFDITERPIDPLFFYKINDEYFYIIHKWGNDLNILQRCKALLSSHMPLMLLGILCFIFNIILCNISHNPLAIISAIISGLLNVMFYVFRAIEDRWISIYPKNKYDEPYSN